MLDRLEKKSDERIDTKLGPVMDRLSALENTCRSTRSGPSSDSGAGNFGGCPSTAPVFAPSYLEIKGWCGFQNRATHGLTEVQVKKLVAKLRQRTGPDLDCMIARVGAMRVRNAKGHLLFENAKPHELQADQGGHERVHRTKEYQNGASRLSSICDGGETCLAAGTTANFWESFGCG